MQISTCTFLSSQSFNLYEFKVLWLDFSLATPCFLLRVTAKVFKRVIYYVFYNSSLLMLLLPHPVAPQPFSSWLFGLIFLHPCRNASLSTHIQFVSHASDSTLRIYLDLNASHSSAAAATLPVVIISPAWITAMSAGTPPTLALDFP